MKVLKSGEVDSSKILEFLQSSLIYILTAKLWFLLCLGGPAQSCIHFYIGTEKAPRKRRHRSQQTRQELKKTEDQMVQSELERQNLML